MKEETNLDIRVERLLMEMTLHFDDFEGVNKTYLCTPLGGVPKPGSEPEDPSFEIAALRWFDLKDDRDWSADLRQDQITYPELALARLTLGYTTLE